MSPGPADSFLPSRYGARFFTEGVPERDFPNEGMRPQDAYQLLVEELELDDKGALAEEDRRRVKRNIGGY
jgi:hypothetical protein